MGELFSMIADLISAFEHKNWRHILFLTVVVFAVVWLIAWIVQSGS